MDIIPGTGGCYAYLPYHGEGKCKKYRMGRNVKILGFGRLEMGLGPGCLWQYVVVHEILHSLGFQHEQKRPDKDDYIQMRWDNIKVC